MMLWSLRTGVECIRYEGVQKLVGSVFGSVISGRHTHMSRLTYFLIPVRWR